MHENFNPERQSDPAVERPTEASKEKSSFADKVEKFYTEAKRKTAARFKPYGKYAFMAAFALSQQACAQYGLLTSGRFNAGNYSEQDRLQDSEDMGKPGEVRKRPPVERAIYGEKNFNDEWMWLNEGLYLPEVAEHTIQSERDAYAALLKARPDDKPEPTLRSLVRPVPQSKDAVRPLVPEAIVRVRPQEGFNEFFLRGLQPLAFVGETGDGVRLDMRDVNSMSTPYWSADPVRGNYREAGAAQGQIAEGDRMIRDYRENLAVGEAVSRLPPEQRGGVTLRPWQSVERRDLAALMRIEHGGRRPPESSLNAVPPAEWNLTRQTDSLAYAMLNERDAGAGARAARTRAMVETLNQVQNGCLILAGNLAENPNQDPTPLAMELMMALRLMGGFTSETTVMMTALAQDTVAKRTTLLMTALKSVQEKMAHAAAMQPMAKDLYVGMSRGISKNYTIRHDRAVVISGMDLPPGRLMPSAAQFASLSDEALKALFLAGGPDDGSFDKRLNEIKEVKLQVTQRALQAYQTAVVMRLSAQVGEAKAKEYLDKATYIFGKTVHIEVFVKADGTGPGKVVVIARIDDPLFLVTPN